MTHAALKLQKIKPQKLKSLGFNEAWLQKQIDEDATLLGLGDLQVIKKGGSNYPAAESTS